MRYICLAIMVADRSDFLWTGTMRMVHCTSDGKIGAEIMRDKLIEAVKLISDYCRHTKCNKCMFDYYGDCMFTHWNDENAWDYTPRFWDTTGIREE